MQRATAMRAATYAPIAPQQRQHHGRWQSGRPHLRSRRVFPLHCAAHPPCAPISLRSAPHSGLVALWLCQEALVETLKAWKALAEAHNLTYWLDQGSLLGADTKLPRMDKSPCGIPCGATRAVARCGATRIALARIVAETHARPGRIRSVGGA